MVRVAVENLDVAVVFHPQTVRVDDVVVLRGVFAFEFKRNVIVNRLGMKEKVVKYDNTGFDEFPRGGNHGY